MTVAAPPESLCAVCRDAEAGLRAGLAEVGPTTTGPLRVGTDVQGVDAVREALSHHGERYLSHLFSDRERAALGGPAAPTERLAPRVARGFAAKEAVVKALRPVRRTWSWREISVVGTGRWEVRLSGGARDLSSRRGVERWALSCVSDATHAVALVVGVGPATNTSAEPSAGLGGT